MQLYLAVLVSLVSAVLSACWAVKDLA